MPNKVSNHLKQLRGTLRHDRQNSRAPTPEVGLPLMPPHLTPGAADVWNELAPLLESMRVVTVADAYALELLCEAVTEYRQARAVLAKLGMTYETVSAAGTAMTRTRPENAIAADAWRRAKLGLSSFGLDPSARGRIETIAAPYVNPFDEIGGAPPRHLLD